MYEKVPVNDFKWVEDISESNEDFIKIYHDNSDEGYFLGVEVQYPENLHNFCNNLPFFPERIKIEKVEELVVEYVIHIINLKQALNHRLLLKRAHRVINFNQKAWLKPDIDINTELRKKDL